jgi:hypothetical protein
VPYQASFPWTQIFDADERRFLTTDYAVGLADIKNKTPGIEPGVCI